VVREIEGIRRDCRTFILEDTARVYYGEASRASMNGPDDSDESDPTIVTNCWLYAADTLDPVAAESLASSERATLMAVCFPPEDA
jgi:hypothetical protein